MSDEGGRFGWRSWFGLYAIGLMVYGAAAFQVKTPGYMDADYYYATGLRLAEGSGLTEPFLWNYIDDPDGLPHPSHLYWMPLPSFVASLGIRLLGAGFRAAQLPFVLLAAALPPLTAFFSLRLARDRRLAWMSGLFATFPGFFLPFMVTTDAFALYAIVGSISLWSMTISVRSPSGWRWLVTGLVVGGASLIRADGVLLMAIALLAVGWSGSKRAVGGLALLSGFLIVMGPWWTRNITVVGAPLNPGGSRLFWMLGYNDLFAFPASVLTFERWRDAGLLLAFQARITALSTNLQRLIGEAGVVLLAPFMFLGGYRMRQRNLVRLSAAYLALLFLVMTVALPYVGPRGALFHSVAGIMPILWALAPIGIKVGIDWLGRRRSWDLDQAQRVLGASAIVLVALLTIGLYGSRLFGSGDAWNASARAYQTAAALLPDPGNGIVAVNNPPGLYAQTGLDAIVIPNGTPDVLRQVLDHYNAGWVLLETNHPPGLDALYLAPESQPWLKLVGTLPDPHGNPMHVLEFRP